MRGSHGTVVLGARATRWLIRTILLLASVALMAALAAGAGAPARASSVAREAQAPTPYSQRQWTQLIATAKREGEVTIFSTQIPALLADMAKAFEAKCGIKVNVNRQVDQLLVTQINAGFSSGNVQADLWVS